MLEIPSRIKELVHQDTCPKNIRIHFPNGERTDICNDLIVRDSVSFTESLVSQDTLKFGLCESPIFECELVGVGNIKGATIEVTCEIFCDASVSGAEFKPDLMAYVYSIPYGTFIVQEAKRQADMQHRKITAYGGTSSFYSGLSNIFEKKGKLNSFPPAFSSVVYDANTFLLAVSNIGMKQYSSDTFNATEISELNDETNYIASEVWEYNGSKIRLYFTLTDKSYGNAFVFRDVLCQINGDIIENAINSIIDDILDIGDRYDMPVQMKSREYWKSYLYVICLKYYQNGTVARNVSYEALPALFYPFLSPTNGGNVEIAYKLKKIQVTHQDVGDVIEEITYNTTYIDNIVALKLEAKYSELNNYITHFENVPIGNGYYRRFVPPADYDNIEELNKIIELSGLLGLAHRNSSFGLVNIKRQFALLPQTSLYPGASVYPQGVTGGQLLPEDYQSCWYDDEYTKPFGAIVCEYKNTLNEDCIFTFYLSGYDENTPTDTYQTYDLSNNNLIKSDIWTEQQISDICNTIAQNIEGVQYMPVEFTGRGLPYVEAGDTFEILTKSGDAITTIVLNRTLTGEQVLTDKYKSV